VNAAAPPGWRLQTHAELDSTQASAIEAARAGDPGRLAIRAELQTAGRGSRGRGWVAPPGNLNLSVLLRPAAAAPDPGRWALLAGVALHDALVCHAAGLMLKWPNDVLLDGAKLGGVLIDSALRADGMLDWVVIGLGVNLVEAPDLPDRRTACLPGRVAAGRIAHDVLAALDARQSASSAEICAAWMRRAHPLGTELEVVVNQTRIAGRFDGLTPQGALLLQGQAAAISTGDVFLRPAVAPCC